MLLSPTYHFAEVRMKQAIDKKFEEIVARFKGRLVFSGIVESHFFPFLQIQFPGYMRVCRVIAGVARGAENSGCRVQNRGHRQ